MDNFDPHLVVDRRPKTGANSASLRNHNERSVLSLLREQGACSSVEIARRLNLSAQTASVIVRQLQDQGIICRLDPVKGKVGKPQTPLSLSAGGAYSFGLRIGRRTSNLVLADLIGGTVAQVSRRYPYPTPSGLEAFCGEAVVKLTGEVLESERHRIVGIGIAAPFELWNWLDFLGAPREEADKWRDYLIGERYARLTGLSTYVANDVNLACMGELMFGRGADFTDFAYFYVGYFVGGAVVLDGKVFHGPRGNAGALGSVPVPSIGSGASQLINAASIFRLERSLAAKLGHPVNLRAEDSYWDDDCELRDRWMDDAAKSLVHAAVSVAAVLDISDIVVDGVFPAAIRSEFVKRLEIAAGDVDQRGIHPVEFHEGMLGYEAGQRGAAYQPILAELLIEGSRLI